MDAFRQTSVRISRHLVISYVQKCGLHIVSHQGGRSNPSDGSGRVATVGTNHISYTHQGATRDVGV
jgi:hypothetical protein